MRSVKNLIIMIIVIVFLSSCSQDVKVYEESKTEDVSDNGYWEIEPQIRVMIIPEVEKAQDEPKLSKSNYKLNKNDINKLQNIDKAIVDCFYNLYKIDLSAKLKNKNILIYKKENINLFLSVSSNKKQIKINEIFFKEKRELLDTIYLHEVMYYIGIISSNIAANSIDVGMAEHFAKVVAEYANIDYNTEDTPYDCFNMVADQMCIVDEDVILNNYINEDNFDICEYISGVIKDVEQPYLKVDSTGEFLSIILVGIGYDYPDNIYGEKGYILAYMSQEIVNAFCFQFNPTKEQIEQIRGLYIVKDIETTDIMKLEQEYYKL